MIPIESPFISIFSIFGSNQPLLPSRQPLLQRCFQVMIGLNLLLLTGTFAQEKQPPAFPNSFRQQQQFYLAQHYQESGRHQTAILILEPIYSSHPQNLLYYQALLRSYLKLSRHKEAAQLVEKQRALMPDTFQVKVDYGTVLYHTGKSREARKIWRNLLKQHSDSPELYSMLANTMLENQLYDEAIAIYQKAVKKHPDKPFLIREMALFYQQRSKYYLAMKYYLSYVKKAPGKHFQTARKILAFDLAPEQIDSLMQLLSKTLKRSRKHKAVRMIAAKFYQKYQHYNKALKLFQSLEDNQTRGYYLNDFARAAQSDSAYTEALQAYKILIKRFPNSPHTLQAYTEAAQCQLHLARQKQEPEFARKALEMLAHVNQTYPEHPYLVKLKLMAADIYQHFFFDLDRSIQMYLDIADKASRLPDIRTDALLGAGKGCLMRGDLRRADSLLKRLDTSAVKAPLAHYYLAKIQFYQGNYPQTNTLLKELLQRSDLSEGIINEALELQIISGFSKKAPEALRRYAAADLYQLQQKQSEALRQLQKALEHHPPPQFRSRLLLLAARLSTALQQIPEALTFCQQILTDSSLAMYADEALYTEAVIVDKQLNDSKRAFQLYDQLLEKFPDSQFSSASRNRLKELRNPKAGQAP